MPRPRTTSRRHHTRLADCHACGAPAGQRCWRLTADGNGRTSRRRDWPHRGRDLNTATKEA